MPARKSRYSEAQIRAFLWQAAAGTPVIDLCWNHSFSRSTFHAWKAKYGETIADNTRQLERLERENARLRKTLAQSAKGASTTDAGREASKAAIRVRKPANRESVST